LGGFPIYGNKNVPLSLFNSKEEMIISSRGNNSKIKGLLVFSGRPGQRGGKVPN
jgi:hypothetical protein